jgi:hypothetical protein
VVEGGIECSIRLQIVGNGRRFFFLAACTRLVLPSVLAPLTGLVYSRSFLPFITAPPIFPAMDPKLPLDSTYVLPFILFRFLSGVPSC